MLGHSSMGLIVLQQAHLSGEEVHVLLRRLQQLRRGGLAQNGQHFGVCAFAEETNGAIGTASNDRHAAPITGEVHDIEYLEGCFYTQKPDLHSILCAVHKLKSKLLTPFNQGYLIWRRTLQRSLISIMSGMSSMYDEDCHSLIACVSDRKIAQCQTSCANGLIATNIELRTFLSSRGSCPVLVIYILYAMRSQTVYNHLVYCYEEPNCL